MRASKSVECGCGAIAAAITAVIVELGKGCDAYEQRAVCIHQGQLRLARTSAFISGIGGGWALGGIAS